MGIAKCQGVIQDGKAFANAPRSQSTYCPSSWYPLNTYTLTTISHRMWASGKGTPQKEGVICSWDTPRSSGIESFLEGGLFPSQRCRKRKCRLGLVSDDPRFYLKDYRFHSGLILICSSECEPKRLHLIWKILPNFTDLNTWYTIRSHRGLFKIYF